jgi:hypothetical protein
MRFRAAGSDLTGASYDETVTRTITGTVSGYTTTGGTSFDFGSSQFGLRTSEITLFNPKTTGAKNGHQISYFYSTASNYRLVLQGLSNQSGTAADSLSIICSTGNFTGTINAYGYN